METSSVHAAAASIYLPDHRTTKPSHTITAAAHHHDYCAFETMVVPPRIIEMGKIQDALSIRSRDVRKGHGLLDCCFVRDSVDPLDSDMLKVK